MSISALATYTQLSPNCNKPRKNPISRITPHHMAGSLSLPQFGALVAKPSRQMSANYAIAKDGSIGAFCDEDNRSWCSSSPYNDHRAVTIEVANDGGASTNWHVSDAALESLVKLCVDICQRNPGLKNGLNIRIDDPSELGGDMVINSVATRAATSPSTATSRQPPARATTSEKNSRGWPVR